jgi:hypothetical protein
LSKEAKDRKVIGIRISSDRKGAKVYRFQIDITSEKVLITCNDCEEALFDEKIDQNKGGDVETTRRNGVV